MTMLNLEIITESENKYKTHFLDEEEAIEIAEKNNCIVAFY